MLRIAGALLRQGASTFAKATADRLRFLQDGSKPVNRTLKALQYTLLAHDFEHMIEAGSNRPAADSNSRWVNKLTGFATQAVSRAFERVFQPLHRPVFNLQVRGSQCGQSL